jgi:hypothetical protein
MTPGYSFPSLFTLLCLSPSRFFPTPSSVPCLQVRCCLAPLTKEVAS